jgi:hypothetical protein
MYDANKILPGIVIFVALAAAPFLYNKGAGFAGYKPDPKIDTPAIKELGAKKLCVEPKAFMRAEHMKLLNEWRDAALRDGKRVYVSSTGKQYEINLQNGCLKCHSNKKKFCDECHNYMGVSPYCWTCHTERKEGAKVPELVPVQVSAPPAEGGAAEKGAAPAENASPQKGASPKEKKA